MNQQYLLILGAPRSGTTLLAAMIGCHRDVALLNEDLGMAAKRIVAKRVVGNKLCIPNQIEMSRKRSRWVGALGGRWFHKLHQYGYFRYRPEALVSIQDYLARGHLKMVGIVRDGNAVISSIMRRGDQPYDVAAYRWCRSIEILSELRERQGDLLLLSYERLVEEPETAMRAVAEHVGIAFDVRMLEGFKYTKAYPNEAGIDANRARKYKEKGIDFDLANRYPEVYAKYAALLQVQGRIETTSRRLGPSSQDLVRQTAP